MLSTRDFSLLGGASPCPICGAPRGSCSPDDALAPQIREPKRIFLAAGYRQPFAHRSREKVYEVVDGHRVLKYGVGTPIPLIEALVQGQVELTSLDEGQRAEIKRHAEQDPALRERLVGKLVELVEVKREKQAAPEKPANPEMTAMKRKKKVPKNKMVKGGQVVKK